MRWTVYCRVIDNFGDIGVGWRLAADLASRGETVRLVADDASALAWLADDPAGSGVEVAGWHEPAGAAPDVAVETFGCGLPEGVAEAWAVAGASPKHVDVEHLSAEPYAVRSHGLAMGTTAARTLPSRLYYPGFVPESGGLLREPGLLARRDAFRAEYALRQVSLFCYDGDVVPALLDALPAGNLRVVCAPGAATAAALAWQSRRQASDHATGGSRRLRIVAAPYVSQARFDERLWASELNLVRGEDSLVRAIWAARPFVWQLYPQPDGAHRRKLEAFLDCFLAGSDDGFARQVRELFRRCNGAGEGSLSLPALGAWRAHCAAFAASLAAQHDLTSRLLAFVPR